MKKRNTRYNRRRNSRKKGISFTKLFASVALPVIAITAGGTAMMHYTSLEKPDAHYCYEREEQFKAAVFLDNSITDLSPAQMRDNQTAFIEAYDDAPANAKVMIFTTASDASTSLAKPVFEQCKPAQTPQEQENINAPAKPAPYLKRQADIARKAYQDAVTQVLSDLKDQNKAAYQSPILEQLQAISRYDGFIGTSRSLTVITDGIQNSELAKFCKTRGDMPRFSTFKNRSDYQLNAKPRSFENTDISLLMLEIGNLPNQYMPHCSGNDEVRLWWKDYFEGNDATHVELTTLRYWAGSQ